MLEIDAATSCISLIILLKGVRSFYYDIDDAQLEVFYG
jgi:hypothetical protein